MILQVGHSVRLASDVLGVSQVRYIEEQIRRRREPSSIAEASDQ